MDKHAPEGPEREPQPIEVLIREFPRKFLQALVNGISTGLFVVGGGFAAATVVGILGNPIWRWGCWLWNLWT